MGRGRRRLRPSERDALFDIARDGPFTRTKVAQALGVTLTELRLILERDVRARSAWDDAQQMARDLVAHRFFELSERAENDGERRHALSSYRDEALGPPEVAPNAQRPNVEITLQLPAPLKEAQYARVLEHAADGSA